MDFSRSSSSQPAAASRASGMGEGGNKKSSWRSTKWLRMMWVILLFAGTVLVISVVVLLYIGGNRENKIVDKSKFQAVFLTNGQVYFGNVVNANGKFIDLKNIYYLSVTNQQVQPKDTKDQQANVSLVKLGCELHGPVDEMVLNRDQVTFWENLRTDGQVSQAIDKWVKANPEGQKCTTPSAQAPVTVLGKDS